MVGTERFLIVEDDADGEFLLQRALRRRFPEAVVHIVHDADEAVNSAKEGEWTGVVIHRALDVDGIEVVQRVRTAAPAARIVMVSARDQKTAALAAGATEFVSFSAWQPLSKLFEPLG